MNKIKLDTLSLNVESKDEIFTIFAFLCLGIIDSLAMGMITPKEALKLFFHADNCLYIHNILENKTADEIMCAGVQLQDAVDILPPDKAQSELQIELSNLHSFCIKLIGAKPIAA